MEIWIGAGIGIGVLVLIGVIWFLKFLIDELDDKDNRHR